MSNTEIVDKNLPNGRPSSTDSQQPQDSAPLHTPGPWESDETNVRGPNLNGNASIVAHAFDPNDLAHRTLVGLANARLIAAAPELLAFARYYLDSEATTDKCDKLAKAAISKAEGKDVQGGN